MKKTIKTIGYFQNIRLHNRIEPGELARARTAVRTSVNIPMPLKAEKTGNIETSLDNTVAIGIPGPPARKKRKR